MRVLLLALGVASSAYAYSPAPRIEPCAPTPQANARYDEMALALARKTFPGAQIAHGCQLFRSTVSVALERVVVTRKGVAFQVPLVVRFREPVSMLDKPTLVPGDWKLEPLESPSALDPYAELIKRDPLVARVLKAPICLVGRDEQALGFLCGTAPWNEETYAPTHGAYERKVTALEFLARDGAAPTDQTCPPFALEDFSIPLALATAKTPGWCAVPKDKATRELAAHGKPGWLKVFRLRGWKVEVSSDGELETDNMGKDERGSCQPMPACP